MSVNMLFVISILFYLPKIACSQTTIFSWKQELAPGNGSFESNWTPGKFPMGIVPVVAFNNHLYMVGNQMTWISTDGKNWTAYTKTWWGERFGMTITYFNEELWAMGGMETWDSFFNDIWASKDGINWRLVQSQAPWAARRGHNVVVHHNKMWLMGGSKSTGIQNKLPTESFNDVWTSHDGLNWTLITSNSNWSGREPRVIVFNNKLYLMADAGKPDIWTSVNGKEWQLLKKSSDWMPRQNYGLLVFDHTIWLFGGRGFNDVWNSIDGTVWSKKDNAPWSKRTASQCVVFLDKIWMYSGKTGRDDSWEGDIWSMKKVN